jgi:hypothetical protein
MQCRLAFEYPKKVADIYISQKLRVADLTNVCLEET